MEKWLQITIPTDDGEVVLEHRHPITGQIEGSLVATVAPLEGATVIDGRRLPMPTVLDGYSNLMADMFWRRLCFGFRTTPLWYVLDIETDDLGGDITHIGVSLVKPSEPDPKGEADHLMVSFIVGKDDPLPRPSEMLAVGCGWNLSYDLPILNKVKRWGYTKTQNFRYGDRVDEIETLYSGDEWVDLMLLTKKWDVLQGGIMTSFSLKEASRFWFPRPRQHKAFATAENIEAYLLEDLEDTASVAICHFPYWKGYADFMGMSYQTLATAGTGWQVENLMCIPYVLKGLPLPKRKQKPKTYTGAYVFAKQGVYRTPVYKWDYTSLYPSVIVYNNLIPKDDVLGLFPKMMTLLRLWRIEAKRKKSPMSQTLKLLINSAYGYMGSSFRFSDVGIAKAITGVGRVMAKWLETFVGLFGEVIEVDTDGVLASVPELPPFADELLNALVFPYSIEKETYTGAYVASAKNYILRKADGGFVIKGNSLRSRKDSQLLQLLLKAFQEKIFEGQEPNEELGKWLLSLGYRLLKQQPNLVAQRQRMGKGIRRLKGCSEALLSQPDGVWVSYYKTPDGWVLAEEDAPVDFHHYLKSVLDWIGRLGGELEAFAKRYGGKRGMDALAEELGLPIRFTKKAKAGNLFDPQTV